MTFKDRTEAALTFIAASDPYPAKAWVADMFDFRYEWVHELYLSLGIHPKQGDLYVPLEGYRRAFELFEAGYGFQEISQHLGIANASLRGWFEVKGIPDMSEARKQALETFRRVLEVVDTPRTRTGKTVQTWGTFSRLAGVRTRYIRALWGELELPEPPSRWQGWTDEKVARIEAAIEDEWSQREICRTFNISYSTFVERFPHYRGWPAEDDSGFRGLKFRVGQVRVLQTMERMGTPLTSTEKVKLGAHRARR